MEGCGSEGLLNSFAVVGYLPKPLSGFVDQVRRELAPGCRARAHITILPPRPLVCLPTAAEEELRRRLEDVAPFQIELVDVQLFRESEVIYISVGAGSRSLEQLHLALNRESCQGREEWDFEPHVTLGQDLDPAAVAHSMEIAAQRWREFTGPRSFVLNHLTFVQNTLDNEWVDLAEFDLRVPRLKPVLR